jgi:Holliday junction resolvase RusA-like endonuclease
MTTENKGNNGDGPGCTPLPWGVRLDFEFVGVDIIPARRYRIEKKFGARKRSIRKDEKSEKFITRLRAGLWETYRAMAANNENVRALTVPLPYPVRVDVFFMYDKHNTKSLKLADLDNLLQGVFNALKVGPVGRGLKFGLIEDDRQIAACHAEKGEAPDDEKGSRIYLRLYRAGFRSAHDMYFAIKAGTGPVPPYDAQNQGRTAEGRRVLTPQEAQREAKTLKKLLPLRKKN